MMIEFLIFCRKEPSTNIREILSDTLNTVLQDNLNEFELEEVQQMIILSTERIGNQLVNESGNDFKNVLLGFSLDLPDETNESQTVVDEFAKALTDNTNPILHIVKFEDPLLQANLAHWAEKIFALEMKLRRVLTLIYLYAYQNGDPFDLLCEELTQPMVKERPKPEQMKAALENQFFHLTFSQYVNLNQRPELKIPDIIKNIKNIETYEIFRAELNRVPVEHEDDAVLLAGLKARMEAIEAMRNCVAHNRRPPRRVIENYENAQPLLNQLLDDYLSQWLWRETAESEIDEESSSERSEVEDA